MKNSIILTLIIAGSFLLAAPILYDALMMSILSNSTKKWRIPSRTRSQVTSTAGDFLPT